MGKIFLKQVKTEAEFPALEGHNLQTKGLSPAQLNCSHNKIYHHPISELVIKRRIPKTSRKGVLMTFRVTVEKCPQTDSHIPFHRGCAPPKQGKPKKEEDSSPRIWAPAQESSKGISQDGSEGNSSVKTAMFNRPRERKGSAALNAEEGVAGDWESSWLNYKTRNYFNCRNLRPSQSVFSCRKDLSDLFFKVVQTGYRDHFEL